MRTPTPSIASVSTPETRSPVNQIWHALPADVRQRLEAASVLVSLKRDALCAELGAPMSFAHFPLSGLVSLQAMSEDGNTIEVAKLGRDGVVGFGVSGFDTGGASLHSTLNAVVLLPGEALRVRADVVRTEFERSPALRHLLLTFWSSQIAAITTGSACHRFHTARQRLARWLLEASALLETSTIQITQDRVAGALGVQRTNVTTVSVGLQDAGLIKARHGRITILNRTGLAMAACECGSSSTVR